MIIDCPLVLRMDCFLFPKVVAIVSSAIVCGGLFSNQAIPLIGTLCVGQACRLVGFILRAAFDKYQTEEDLTGRHQRLPMQPQFALLVCSEVGCVVVLSRSKRLSKQLFWLKSPRTGTLSA